MATENMNYKDKGFLTSDIFMQLAFHYINEELKKADYIFTKKEELQEYHRMVINGEMGGWFAFLWDSYISDSSEEQTMIQILQNVKNSIQNKGSYISTAELQSIPTKDGDFKIFYNKPFPTEDLNKIIGALIKMLEGTWDLTNYDMYINYYYSRVIVIPHSS
ncbi:hypothetical protein [Chryseobacterium sp. OSA05B]|uniref:hypothetical protein n=1 Tax=Chryseobacterium sp. OSA05B TaxID=2862650 RepID=UPI001CBCC080|nr:hypothetical protein [Chryseobacterium sp. OSA05B]